jgi:simple sugar transport system permease protein
MSEITERSPQAVAPPPGPAPRGAPGPVRAALNALARQREATVFVIAVILLLYFGIKYNSTFVSQTNLANLLSETAAPIIILSIGEVFLLICGEIDLSVGFVYMLSPFLMHYLIDFYGVPVVPAIIISLLMGLVVGWSNGFLTVTMGLPSFITTLGTGFILWGIARLPGEHPRGRCGHRALDRRRAVVPVHLGLRDHRDLLRGAEPDQVGPVHDRYGR